MNAIDGKCTFRGNNLAFNVGLNNRFTNQESIPVCGIIFGISHLAYTKQSALLIVSLNLTHYTFTFPLFISPPSLIEFFGK